MTVEEIKRYMKQKKITYQDLSSSSGIPLTTLKYIFSGRTESPRIDTMQAIEHALGLDEKKPLADTIIEQVDELNLQDYNNLSEDEKRKIAEIFNATVSAFKKK
ncbi:MAG: helix-turn-helix transcriptional regulator [Clostridiales bacterium]|nr:helix-turn-helix transcriptional regulator [Clostridiales bacterium]